jgi:hypothetical protein
MMDEDGYDGAADLLVDGIPLPITVQLAGHFDPITGSYSWYGRVAASPEITALMAGGVRKAVLRTPHAEVETALSDVDPWGRPRVQGFGAAPFAVLDDVPD